MKRRRSSKSSMRRWSGIGLTILSMLSGSALQAQGILTVTPPRGAVTVAGTGAVGYTGDNGAAVAATLASPSAIAYDANGNLYLADARNHVVRELSKSGQITTIAGTGIEGYGGDNGPATASFLDTPTGVAIDSSGNVYIADSHNHRVRKIVGSTITTIAGTGTAGFAGDGGAASLALLWLPSAIALDSSGNVYIADTNNQRIRKITGSTITTIAGNGEELFAGDGAAAVSAVLDLPTGVAVDAAGNVYIADRHNQRVRMIAPAGTISTIAGSGAASFSGGYSGDGAVATAATLARPSGVSIDSAGNIYIADTGNQRIRQVGGGAITTIVGTGQQGFGGDGGIATGAILNSPKAVAPDASGNVTIADSLNERLRAATLPILIFANSGVGISSAAQSVTLANTGSASITVSSITVTGAFAIAPGGSCTATPITLAPGASCTENVVFLPVAPGAASGSVAFGGTGVVPQSILLTGASVQGATTVTLTSNAASPFAGQPVTFTATVKPTGVGTPTGTVSFFDGTTLIGTATLTGGSTSLTTTLTAGTHSITAVYSGDTNFTGSTSSAFPQTVVDFAISATPPVSHTLEPGQAASYAFNLLPVGGPFLLPITLSASGLPVGATATFTPQIVTIGTGSASFTMKVQTTVPAALLRRGGVFSPAYGGGTITLGLLLLPFFRKTRRTVRRMRPLTLCAALILSLAATLDLAGCGSSSGFFGQPEQTYTINVLGTAPGAGGTTLQHSTTVTLTVQ